MEKSNLFCLTDNDNGHHEREVLLDKMSDQKFRVLEFGKFKPVLCNGTLVEESIAEVLQKYVPDQIGQVTPVIIWRKSTDETWTNYCEIEVRNHLDLDNFGNARYDGYRIYHLMYDSLYISPALKDKFILEHKKIDGLNFVNEWPTYGG